MSFLDLKEWKSRLNSRFSGEPQPVEQKLKSALAEVQAGRLDLNETALKSWAIEHDIPEAEHERFIREALESGEAVSDTGETVTLKSVLKSIQGLQADVAALREDAEDLFGPGIAFSMDRLEELEGAVTRLKAQTQTPPDSGKAETESSAEPDEVQKLKSQIADLSKQVEELGAQPVNPKQPITERTDAPKRSLLPRRSAVLKTLQKGYSAGRIELADITQFETSGELSRRAQAYWTEAGETQAAA